MQSNSDTEQETGIFERMERVQIGGLPTVTASRVELAQAISDYCESVSSEPARRPKLIFSANGQGIALGGSDPDYDAAMDAADVVHADGMSVVFASRMLTQNPIAERSATTDLFHDIAREANAREQSFYVFGGKPEQNRKAVEAMRADYPRIRIVGARHGYFSSEENDAICAEIAALRPDVLWVALGKPLQETWSHRNRDKLEGVGVIKTCGGLFAFLADDVERAPEWMQRAGLEWFFRMKQEPGRLLVRYLTTNARSVWKMVRRSG